MKQRSVSVAARRTVARRGWQAVSWKVLGGGLLWVGLLTSACSKQEPAQPAADAANAKPAEQFPYVEADSSLQEMVKAGGHVMPPKGTVSPIPTPESKASPEFDAAFGGILQSYYAVRDSLANDSIENVRPGAEKLKDAVEMVRKAPSPAVTDADKQTLTQTLDEVVTAADALLKSTEIKGAREAFAQLSKPVMYVVAFHYHGETPQIFFCPMKNLAWLQSDPKISNPYYGKEMLECGLKVKKSS